MSLEVAFEGAKAAMLIFGGSFEDVAIERALALHAKQGEGFAAVLSTATKERLAGRELDLSAFGAVYRQIVAKGFGMACEVAAGPGSLRTNWGGCSLQERLAAAGLDHETIGRMCRAGFAAVGRDFEEGIPETLGTPGVPDGIRLTLRRGICPGLLILPRSGTPPTPPWRPANSLLP